MGSLWPWQGLGPQQCKSQVMPSHGGLRGAESKGGLAEDVISSQAEVDTTVKSIVLLWGHGDIAAHKGPWRRRGVGRALEGPKVLIIEVLLDMGQQCPAVVVGRGGY